MSAPTPRENVVGTLFTNVSAVFRHVLPGAVALGLARLSQPDWFWYVHLSKTSHLILLGVIAIVVGNVIYVIHKHTVHQFFDRCIAKECRKSPDYVATIAGMTLDHFYIYNDGLRGFMDQRNSQIILMSITAELSFFAALLSKPCSFAYMHASWLVVGGFVAWVISFFAQRLSFQLATRLALSEADKVPARDRIIRDVDDN